MAVMFLSGRMGYVMQVVRRSQLDWSIFQVKPDPYRLPGDLGISSTFQKIAARPRLFHDNKQILVTRSAVPSLHVHQCHGSLAISCGAQGISRPTAKVPSCTNMVGIQSRINSLTTTIA